MPLPVMAAAALVGRLLLAAIFLHEAWSKLTGYSAALAYMQAFGVPGQLLPLAIAVEVGCGVLILCGYHFPFPGAGTISKDGAGYALTVMKT